MLVNIRLRIALKFINGIFMGEKIKCGKFSELIKNEKVDI